MTPEELAMMPAHPHPREQQDREDLVAVNRIRIKVRALRVLRAASEYPFGHPERDKRAAIVEAWENEFGPAPESANAVLDAE